MSPIGKGYGMSVAEVSQMVTSVGFPIVCCIFMWKYLTTTMRDITSTMVKNTEVLTRLVEKLEKDEEAGHARN